LYLHQGSEVSGWGLRFRVQIIPASKSRVKWLGVRVQGSCGCIWIRVQRFGVRGWGLGFVLLHLVQGSEASGEG
jgi:hypothetical protein